MKSDARREVRRSIGLGATLSLILAIIVLLITGWVSYLNLQRISRNDGWVVHTHYVLDELRDILATLSAAESSQRSYLITADPHYLEPYTRAAALALKKVKHVRELTADNPSQQERVARLEPAIEKRLSFLRAGVDTRNARGLEGARDYVSAGQGREQMKMVSAVLNEMQAEELRLLALREHESRLSYRVAVATLLISTALGLGLVLAAYRVTIRELRTRAQGVEALARANDELEDRVLERTAELNSANESLQRSNRELEQFASVASHDLQEPLRKIQAFGDRLQTRCSQELGEQGRDYLARMQSSATRMRSLIDALLSFSRVTTKAQPFSQVDLSATAQDVVSDLEERVQRMDGRVQVGDLPTLEADPLQMRQLLQNLIGNGLKFARPNEPPMVRVQSRLLPQENGEIPRYEISVQDNGIGFEEIYLDRIFELFQRLHGRQEYEGTGMGLAICRKIVERHGGQITAKSAPEMGATFLVTLPSRQQ